jgi:hypothetical protein
MIAGLLLILSLVGLVACFVEQPRLAPADPAAAHWVRTNQGWERAVWLEHPTPEPGLHPAVVATFLILFSVLVLVACQPPSRVVKPVSAPRPAPRRIENCPDRLLARQDTFGSW